MTPHQVLFLLGTLHYLLTVAAQAATPLKVYKGAGMDTQPLSLTLSLLTLLVSLTLGSLFLTRMPGSLMGKNRHTGFDSQSLAM